MWENGIGALQECRRRDRGHPDDCLSDIRRMSDVAALLDLCRSRNLTVATAESCTGGMLAAALTDLPGSSDVFVWGAVSYANSAKRDMLGVSQMALVTHGAVSEAVARQMAAGALSRSGAGLAMAITGIAGPGGSEHKPEGRVCFAVADADGIRVETVEFGALGRDAVRVAARDHAVGLLLRGARDAPAPDGQDAP